MIKCVCYFADNLGEVLANKPIYIRKLMTQKALLTKSVLRATNSSTENSFLNIDLELMG